MVAQRARGLHIVRKAFLKKNAIKIGVSEFDPQLIAQGYVMQQNNLLDDGQSIPEFLFPKQISENPTQN